MLNVPDTSVALPRVKMQARATANQTLTTAGTFYPVTLDAEDFDTHNAHSQTTNSARFVAPRTDDYYISGQVAFNTGATSSTPQRLLRVVRGDGSLVPGANAYGVAVASTYFMLNFPPVLVTIAKDSYIELQAWSQLANTVLYSASGIGAVFCVTSA